MWDLKMIDYCLSIVLGYAYCMLLYSLSRVLSWACNCVDDDDDAHNDHRDHVTSDEYHIIINIKELAGIEPSVLRSIPVVDYNSRDFKDGLECVVCLSELVDGDKARLLPTCNHWFHTDCIDPWLQLHSSCPICRNRVGLVQKNDPTSEFSLVSTLDESPAVIQVTYSGNATSFCV